MLAVVADSDPGAVYEQHRWLGAIVAASAVCAFVAMMGWATLRHGGLSPPVLLMALALAAVPFLLPDGFFLPAAALAVAGSALLATHGLAHPPASPDGARFLTGFFTAAAPLLAISQAIAVGFHDVPDRPRAKVLGSYALVAPKDPAPPAESEGRKAARSKPAAPAPDDTASSKAPAADAAPALADAAPDDAAPGKPAAGAPAPADGTPDEPVRVAPAPDEAAPSKPVPAEPAPDKPAPAGGAPAPVAAPRGPVAAAARDFVRDYYAALDARKFGVAWQMLAPGVRSSFGTFAGWRKGYARTVSHSAGDLQVFPVSDGAVVWLTLRAGDRSACGTTVVRRFVVTWRLARTEAGWRATAADARKVGGPEPSAVCAL